MNTAEKKNKILEKAEVVFSEKGLNESSMGEIARLAGVSESIAYQHFKGKEDLLFATASEKMKDRFQELVEHLQGIKDPESRLRKFIWYYLHHNFTNRSYATIVLLECRSNRNFYQNAGYGWVRKYAGLLLGLLKDGVEKGAFRSDVNMRLVRDCIFGVLDLENLGLLVANETEETIPDLEDIVSLILPMIMSRTSSPGQKHANNKKTRILRAGEKVFSKKGFHSATINEIAGLADVAPGTVYQYFDNKEDLFFSIAEQRTKEHIDATHELFKISNPLRKLRRFLRFHFHIYLTEREYLRVFLLDLQLNRRFYGSTAHGLFGRYLEILYPILDEGKGDGTIRGEVNNRIFKNLFVGAFNHVALRWLIVDKSHESDKIREIDELVSLLCRSVAADPYETS